GLDVRDKSPAVFLPGEIVEWIAGGRHGAPSGQDPARAWAACPRTATRGTGGRGEAISARVMPLNASNTARLMRRQGVLTGQSASISQRSPPWPLHSVSAFGLSSAPM